MANSKSAIKRHRQSLKRNERNRARRSEARNAVRYARALIADGEREEAETAVREAASILDRVARKGTLHRNTAARSKSRLMRAFNNPPAPPHESKPKRRRSRAKTADDDSSDKS